MNDEFGDKDERQPGGSFSGTESAGSKIPIFWICVLVVVSSLLFLPGWLPGYIFLAVPLIAIAAKIRIVLCNGRLMGRAAVDVIIVICTLMLLLMVVMLFSGLVDKAAKRPYSEAHFEYFSGVIEVYAKKHDGQLPPGDSWCDVLILEEGVSHDSYRYYLSDCRNVECCFAMNKYSVGKKLSELPGDMILFYETNLGMSDKRSFPVKERGFVK